MLHTHVHGTQVVVRMMNDTTGKEIRTIDQDLNYDFNFQETRYLKEPIELLPGISTVIIENELQHSLFLLRIMYALCLIFLFYLAESMDRSTFWI